MRCTFLPRRVWSGHAEQCGCQLRIIITLLCHPLLHTSSAQLEWQRPRPFIMTSCGVIYSLSDSPLLVAAYWCSKSMQSKRSTFRHAILLLLLFSLYPFLLLCFSLPLILSGFLSFPSRSLSCLCSGIALLVVFSSLSALLLMLKGLLNLRLILWLQMSNVGF